MSAGSGAAAAAAAARIQAIRSMGVIVQVDGPEFLKVLAKQAEPVVVYSSGGFFFTNYHYLTSYKGLAFYARLTEELFLPEQVELILARSIYVPG